MQQELDELKKMQAEIEEQNQLQVRDNSEEKKTTELKKQEEIEEKNALEIKENNSQEEKNLKN